jgi:hypothetical protein
MVMTDPGEGDGHPPEAADENVNRSAPSLERSKGGAGTPDERAAV